MVTYINLYPKQEFALTFAEARWLYDMGMIETLKIKDHYDWSGQIFDKRKRLDDIFGAPLTPGPKI